MKITKDLLEELKAIIKEEYGYEMDNAELEKFAYSLVGYFSLLKKIANRNKFGNSPAGVIDSKGNGSLDKRKDNS